jgi:hypothetical protein
MVGWFGRGLRGVTMKSVNSRSEDGERRRPNRVFPFAAVALVLAEAARASAAEQIPASDPGVTPEPSVPAESAAGGSATTPAPSGAPAPTAAASTEPAPGAEQTQPAGDERLETGAGLFESNQSAAEPAKASRQGDAASESPTFDLNGYVRGDVFVGKVPGASGAMTKAAYGELALKLKVKRQSHGDAYAEARLRYGDEESVRQTSLSLREAYVNLYAGPLDLRLGQQIIVWGRADGFNPTNNLTPLDLRTRSPIEDDRRLGNVGARAFLNFAVLRLEAVWLPVYAATELPTSVALPSGVSFGQQTRPSPKLQNSLRAGRLHIELPAFEASASYLFGYAPLPGLALQDFNAGRSYGIRIGRTPYKQHVIGGDFSTVLADYLGLRGEAAYRIPLDWQEHLYSARPDLQYVLGVDHTFGSLSAIAQYIGRYTLDWARQVEPSPPFDPAILGTFTDPLPSLAAETITASINEVLAARNQILFAQTVRVQHLATLRLEWLTRHETLSLSALAMLNFTTKEWLVYPKVSYQISDGMSSTIGAEIYQGPHDTLLGLMAEERSAGYAELRFSF